MPEAPWRRRFRAARLSLPTWARDEPQRLLYSSNAGGKWELYTWDRQRNTQRQLTDRPEGTTAGALDPSGEWVWWFDDDHNNECGRWQREPFAGGGPRLAAPTLPAAYSAGLAIGRAGAVVGLASDEGVQVHLVPPSTPPRLLYAHREDAQVAGLSRDESLVCVGHAEHGDSRHPALRILDREGRPLADLWDGPGRGLWAAGWSPVAGDQRLLVEHEREGVARPLIWRVDSGAQLVPAVDLPGEVGASWYPDALALLLKHDYRGRVELYRLDLSGGHLQRLPTEPGTIARAVVRPDGEVWYEWTSAARPPEVRSGARLLLQPPGEPAPGGMPFADHTVEDIHFFLAEPAGPRPHPTIFLVHGGPEYHNGDAFSPSAQAWVDHGYAVVLVNYRGSTGYGQAWRDALVGNPGLTELADVAKVHDWLLAAGIADARRSVLSGGSWGGYLTLLGLGTQPERWSLGFAAVPVADYVAAYEDEMEPLKALDRALFGGAPAEIAEAYRARSPITYAERVRVPVLILAGEKDPRCPIRQIDNYLARLRELGKPHEVYRYNAGHGSLVIEETIRQVAAELGFAARHLGTTMPL